MATILRKMYDSWLGQLIILYKNSLRPKHMTVAMVNVAISSRKNIVYQQLLDVA